MSSSRNLQRRAFRKIAVMVALIGLSLQSRALAEDAQHRLQGIFCNTEGQIDQAIAFMRSSLTPRSAVALANKDKVVCNYVDLIEYNIDRPSVVGVVPGVVLLIKYEAMLTAVVVGGNVRQVSPPVRVFFVSRSLLPGTSIERGV
jgi:hypothetical protein